MGDSFVKDEEYIEFIQSCHTEAKDARRPLEKVWEELWQLFQNKQDWSKKSNWQSKAFVPKIFNQVFKASGEVKRAVSQTKKLFKFELVDNEYLQRMQNLREMRFLENDPDNLGMIQQEIEQSEQEMSLANDKMLMWERCFKRELGDSNFVKVYSEHVMTAFLLGLGVIKVLWSDGHLRYENVDVFNFFISPEWLPFQEKRAKYVIERKEMDLEKLKKMAKQRSSPYKSSEVKKIEEDMNKQDIEAQERRRKGYGDFSKPNRRVELWEFWGDFISKDGKIEENMLYTVANGKYLIRKQQNLYSHGLPPYILTFPISYPHRGIAGVSIVQPMAKLQYLYNNIINMVADNLNFSVNKVFEYNPTDLKSPQSLTAVYPGKLVPTNVSDRQVLREVITTPVGSDAIKFLGSIDKDMQESTSVTKPISGITDSTRKTLGQHRDELAQARSTFDIIGRDLEENSIKPLLEMSYDLLVQFADYEERQGKWVLTVGGVTMIMSQAELIEHVREVMSFALQAPPLTQMTDLADLWKRFLSIYNLQDVYEDPQGGAMQLRPQQKQNIQQKAQADARQAVAQMSPQEINNGINRTKSNN